MISWLYCDQSVAAFLLFFPTENSFLPFKLGKSLNSTTVCMHEHTFCLNSDCKMLIDFLGLSPLILIFPTIANSTNTRDRHCCQWANFTMGPNEQNQHFAELRQKVCLNIHAVVLLRGFVKFGRQKTIFLWEKRKKRLAQPSQTDYTNRWVTGSSQEQCVRPLEYRGRPGLSYRSPMIFWRRKVIIAQGYMANL